MEVRIYRYRIDGVAWVVIWLGPALLLLAVFTGRGSRTADLAIIAWFIGLIASIAAIWVVCRARFGGVIIDDANLTVLDAAGRPHVFAWSQLSKVDQPQPDRNELHLAFGRRVVVIDAALRDFEDLRSRVIGIQQDKSRYDP